MAVAERFPAVAYKDKAAWVLRWKGTVLRLIVQVEWPVVIVAVRVESAAMITNAVFPRQKRKVAAATFAA
jgi:hypothetical protein